MSDIKAWNVVAESNTAAPPDGWPENMSYANVNNGLRELQSSVARWHRDSMGYLSSTGSSSLYTVAPEVTYASYTSGIMFCFVANHTNTGPAQLRIDALAYKEIRDAQGSPLAPGDIAVRQVVPVQYDSVNGYFRAVCIGSAGDAFLSVRQFGAVGDGVANDTTAIQTAIDTIEASGGGTLYFPRGTYLLSDTLLVDSNNVRLLGDGMWNTTLSRTGDYGDTIFVTGDDVSGTRLENFEFSGFTINSGGLTTSGAHLALNAVFKFRITEVYMNNGFVGILFKGATQGYVDTFFTTWQNAYGGQAAGRKYLHFTTSAGTYPQSTCGGIFLSNFNVRGTVVSSHCEHGIDIDTADGIWFCNGHVGGTTGSNWRFNSATASPNNIGLVFITTVMSDKCQGHGMLFEGNTSYGTSIYVSNCSIKAGGGSGIRGIYFATTLEFTSGGTYEVVPGDTITGATSGATAVVSRVVLTSGTWAGGDAVGRLFVEVPVGTFEAEDLNVGANADVASISGDAVAAQFRSLQFVNCGVQEFREHGISVESKSVGNLVFNGCRLGGNSFDVAEGPNLGLYDGYNILGGTRIQILGGISGGANVSPEPDRQRHGIYIGANVLDVLISDVDLRDNIGRGLNVHPTALSKVKCSQIATDEDLTVASAAPLNLPADGDAFVITGTTNFANITASIPGRVVTLLFENVLTVSNTGNLDIEGPMKTAPQSSLTLVWTGAKWREISRSWGNDLGNTLTVASASPMVIPPGARFVRVTGSTVFTNITGTYDGHIVTLSFEEAITLNDNGNKLLAGTFTGAANSTLTLACYGNDWQEVSRSIN